MKSIIKFFSWLAILFPATLMAQAVPPAPAPHFTFHESYPVPSGYPHRNAWNPYTGATIYVYTSDPSGVIRKPIIVPEGFDPQDSVYWAEMYWSMNQQNTVECLRSLGFDFIVINFDSGGEYIELNAYTMAKVIEWVNATKVTPYKNIIIGPSMGGLISRYALTYMENQNINHDSRLMISFDAPQYGANVPLGLQYNLLYFNGMRQAASATEKYEMIETRAACEMLLYHIDPTVETKVLRADDVRYSFDQNLHALGDWPWNVRKVGISNGSGYGRLQLKADNVTPLQPEDQIFSYAKDTFLPDQVFARAWAVPIGRKFRIARCNGPGKYVEEFEIPLGSKPYDNMPGGFRRFTGELKGMKNDATSDKQCFIPTISALAIATDENYYNVAADPNVMNKTHFDAIYYPVENQQHVYISPENKNWMFNEIMPSKLDVSTTFLKKSNIAEVQASQEIHLLPGFSTTGGPDFRIFINQFGRCNGPAAPMVSGEKTENFSTVADIQEQQLITNLLIYPNPASNSITIDAQTQAIQEIQLLQADGRLISSVNPQGSHYQMNVSDLNTGMYFLKITNSKESVVKKITVTH